MEYIRMKIEGLKNKLINAFTNYTFEFYIGSHTYGDDTHFKDLFFLNNIWVLDAKVQNEV